MGDEGVCVCLTRSGFVLDQGTLVPWQRLLEGLGEVEETPPNDHIVVEGHKETHLQYRNRLVFKTQSKSSLPNKRTSLTQINQSNVIDMVLIINAFVLMSFLATLTEQAKATH